MKTKNDLRRLLSKVQFSGECWLWLGAKAGTGYASFRDEKSRPAHRVMYELCRGPIPEGLDLDHLCRVRHCVNPWHLEPVTRSENLRRGEVGRYWGEQTHCIHGHEFTPENTRRTPKQRQCRTCGRDRMRRYYEEKKQRG